MIRRRGWLAAGLLGIAVGAMVLVPLSGAQAHPLSTSAVLLDVESDRVIATVELPLDELRVSQNRAYTSSTVVDPVTLAVLRQYVRGDMTATDAEGRDWSTVVRGGRVEKIDGIDHLVFDATLTPASGSVRDFVFHYDAIIDRLVSHRVFVSGRYGHTGSYTTLAMLSWQTESVPVAAASPDAIAGLIAAAELGVHHIASGSDHLLFLLMLLLPASLVIVDGRWRARSDGGPSPLRRSTVRVVHVVTAFAIGHSITLALGALGWIDVPTPIVESGIALSVLVSALHAIRPIVRRGELIIAGGFGLLHGLSFATLLGSLDLSRGDLVGTLVGFNIGIELAQLIVIAAVVPSLYVLSRTARFPIIRVGIAAIGAALATGWLVARTGLVSSNPLEPLGEALVEQPLALPLCLAVLATGAVIWHDRRLSPSGGRIDHALDPVGAHS